jgi:uncharacterized membrane protein YhaH (DUF805 family)
MGMIIFLEVMYLFPGSISHTIQNRFDLNGEANIPTWYSAMLLYTVAMVGFGLFWQAPRSPRRSFWLAFALIYAFLSLDEMARLHEIFDSPAIRIEWLYVYAPFAAAFFAVCVYGLVARRLAEREAARWIVGGLIIYAAGGMGMEALNYFLPLPDYWARVSIMLEEGLEMMGTTGVLLGCLVESKWLM